MGETDRRTERMGKKEGRDADRVGEGGREREREKGGGGGVRGERNRDKAERIWLE